MTTVEPGASLDGEQLTDLLMRLLLDADLRARLAEEGAEAVAADPGELECLASVDLAELDTTARRLRSQVWRPGSGGSLATTFPRSLRLLQDAGATESDLLTGFLGSPHFARFRLIPYTAPGLSAEEAFASYLLDDAGSGALRDTVTHELMIALFTALTCEQPLSFVIEAEGIVPTDRGHTALRTYAAASVATWGATSTEHPETTEHAANAETVQYAYFTTSAGLAHGVVSGRVAAAFEAEPSHRRETARRALARRGLW
ncbi:hypothetical protein [Streptomyces pseudovenezuelae]|uniref:Uncharacterized protein n=1 Tax=Streptomyces pseudovenezuelae TaxID=67350 RepID=A0ABT6M130_9ACTN|nr:hypothetical protein [Streptomyces pseudovenezuelae]MDH6222258.1 hypothetical protein [Streptomyces pseudovenezuelae]